MVSTFWKSITRNPLSNRTLNDRLMHARLSLEQFEPRLLLAGDIGIEGQQANAFVEQLPLPTKKGQEFVLEDYDNKVTKTDRGSNYFGGNNGELGDSVPILVADSSNRVGQSLRVFARAGDSHGGIFTQLLGRAEVEVAFRPNGPVTIVDVPDSSLDLQDVYGGFQAIDMDDRSVNKLRFDVKHEMQGNLTIRVELKDASNGKLFEQDQFIPNTQGDWRTVEVALPQDLEPVQTLALVVEDSLHPPGWSFLIDNIRFVDTDGVYPDLDAAASPLDKTLLPEYEDAFLDWVRQTSSLYFLDFASHFPDTGGIVQDRTTFADLMTVGGVGFQLSSYIIDVERGYLMRPEAAKRVYDILRVLQEDQRQGPEPVGTIGHNGFFYHFLGIDGLRKQNHDFVETPFDETLNTIELSTIDTALALAGIVTAGQYFDGDSSDEMQIRKWANEIYERVDWGFMLYENPECENDPNDPQCKNDLQNQQFYLAWKPNETRDVSGQFGRFRIDDDDGLGQYSSKCGPGGELPATIDFYTDEGLLIALLAMGSPNPDHRLGREVWDSMFRDTRGGSFVRTFPGSLFTYQFASVWLDTESLGKDNHPTRPINFFDNTRAAIDATRDYAIENRQGRATLNEHRWGLSAAEGPFDVYHAHAANKAAVAPDRDIVVLEGEVGTEDGEIKDRSCASKKLTVQLDDGETRMRSFVIDETKTFDIKVRYSNDNFGPLETVEVSIDGAVIGSFQAQDTGDDGNGWDNFRSSGTIGTMTLSAGEHELELSVSGGDGGGVEIDNVILDAGPMDPILEDGTVTNYAVGSSVVHAPAESIAALWHSAHQVGMLEDGVGDLLHPRFGFADAFNFDIAEAAKAREVDCNAPEILRCTGSWANFNGFSIDHGPMLIIIDNYLEDNFIPSLFMSHPGIDNALSQLFTRTPISDLNGNGFVDFEDLTILLANWNQDVGPEFGNIVDTLNTPVNFNDLTVLLADWTGPGPNAAPGVANGQLAVAAGSVGRDDDAAGSNDDREVAAGAVFNRLGRRDSSRDHGGRARRAELVSPLRRLQAVAVDRAMGERDEVTTRRDDRTTRRFIRDPARFLAGGR